MLAVASAFAVLPSPPATVAAMADVSSVMPKHGTVSIKPATKWDEGLAAGNGIMGAMLYGGPVEDTILVNHCKLWLPAGSGEVLPNAGDALPEMRRLIGESGYRAGQQYFLQKAREPLPIAPFTP